MNQAHTHDEPGMVYACPECDRASLGFRQLTRDYRCTVCGAVTDEPVERPSVQGVSGSTGEVTRALAHGREVPRGD